jgi:ubiquinone/menaquinone biosynthesis C-methylase UbiE
MEPKQPAYDDIAATYNEALDPEGSGLRDPLLADLLRNVRGLWVLSLACGQDRDARLLADLGAMVVGVDVSSRLLMYARRFEQSHPRHIQYVLDDAQGLHELDDASFDVVVCYMALMDMPNLEAAITAVARVMRPGGRFVASVVHPCYAPHLQGIDSYLVDGPYRKTAGPAWLPPHAYHRSLSTYVNVLAAAGLSITRLAEPADATPTDAVPNLLYFVAKAAT